MNDIILRFPNTLVVEFPQIRNLGYLYGDQPKCFLRKPQLVVVVHVFTNHRLVTAQLQTLNVGQCTHTLII